ncbi:MAG: ABC transporter permease subunit, partial [Lachnospiraceae bacterium]
KHLLKNAILPAVAYMGPMTAYLLTGSFAVESIFTIPGLGREFVYSIGNRDYTLIMGLTIFMGMMVIAMGILSDIICKFLNPMIQDGRGGGNR